MYLFLTGKNRSLQIKAENTAARR